MKKTLTYALSALAIMSTASVGAQWKPAGDKIKTEWAAQVDPSNVLPEYPRPQMVRGEWLNLNGLWNFAMTPRGTARPASYGEKILVPFAVESSLSGVQKTVTEKDELWYNRSFTVPSSWNGRNVMLNFGAVDWQAEVYVNGTLVGSHKGGFTPFSFNITPFLSGRGAQQLSVRVWDPTDKGFQPRGKQVMQPRGIWYTAVSGIWQTVWLEPVAAKHITGVVSIPDLDSKSIGVTVNVPGAATGDVVEVTLLDGATTVATARGPQGQSIALHVENPKLWSPDSPFLYDMKVTLRSGKNVVDQVRSYTAMRKISVENTSYNVRRMYLNNQPLFHFGPLDQGWWPDGLFTAPTDEALLWDVKKTKDLGFNMIRKHAKVEPARWYYHCDREGILVWQDMPSGDGGNRWEAEVYGGGEDKKRTDESKENFRREWREIMDLCMSNPSVVVWTPFNEAWGQFDTEIIAGITKQYDPSRLVNPASGGNHRDCGDIQDSHSYPQPGFKAYDARRASVIGEYGGIGIPMEGHLWNPDMRNWGYVQFKTSDEVTDEYVRYCEIMKHYVVTGCSGAVYTQTTDVEGEVNGLITYDRKVIKMNEARVRKANREVIEAMNYKR
jgi:beta-galactosidase/beta-glucuronidase